jgi:hypothetical protein
MTVADRAGRALIGGALAALVALTNGCGGGSGPGAAPAGPDTSVSSTVPGTAGTAGTAKLAAFVTLGSGEPPAVTERTEITEPAALQRYLASLQPKAANSLRSQLAGRDPARAGDRLFAFTRTGCAETTAVLTIGTTGTALDRLSAHLAGGRHEECLIPVYFLALFTVPVSLLPR